jgi:hypothetical protein
VVLFLVVIAVFVASVLVGSAIGRLLAGLVLHSRVREDRMLDRVLVSVEGFRPRRSTVSG